MFVFAGSIVQYVRYASSRQLFLLCLRCRKEILLGRNSDFLTDLEKKNMNVIYRLAGGAYSFTGNTTAFVEMEDGINEQGLAVGLTSVYPCQCKPGFNAGLFLRYMLEKCQDVSEAVSCLYHLPIASAQTFTLADTTGKIALVECNGEHVQCTDSLSGMSSFVCATNTFHLGEMTECNCPEIDDWFAQTRYETLLPYSVKKVKFQSPFRRETPVRRLWFSLSI